MRKPLDVPIESRDGNKTLTKDSKLSNFMKDPLAPEKILKRPGMWQSNVFSPTGQGFGIISFEDTVYSWTDATDPEIPDTGIIDESLMPRGFIWVSGSTIQLIPDNPFNIGDFIDILDGVVVAGTEYEITDIDGDILTISSANNFVTYSPIDVSQVWGMDTTGNTYLYKTGSTAYKISGQGGAISTVATPDLATSNFVFLDYSTGINYFNDVNINNNIISTSDFSSFSTYNTFSSDDYVMTATGLTYSTDASNYTTITYSGYPFAADVDGVDIIVPSINGGPTGLYYFAWDGIDFVSTPIFAIDGLGAGPRSGSVADGQVEYFDDFTAGYFYIVGSYWYILTSSYTLSGAVRVYSNNSAMSAITMESGNVYVYEYVSDLVGFDYAPPFSYNNRAYIYSENGLFRTSAASPWLIVQEDTVDYASWWLGTYSMCGVIGTTFYGLFFDGVDQYVATSSDGFTWGAPTFTFNPTTEDAWIFNLVGNVTDLAAIGQRTSSGPFPNDLVFLKESAYI